MCTITSAAMIGKYRTYPDLVLSPLKKGWQTKIWKNRAEILKTWDKCVMKRERERVCEDAGNIYQLSKYLNLNIQSFVKKIFIGLKCCYLIFFILQKSTFFLFVDQGDKNAQLKMDFISLF